MYTIEELVVFLPYTKSTIYNLCVSLGIKPIRGQIKGKNTQGKGLYSENDLDRLDRYTKLIAEGKTKPEAVKIIVERSADGTYS